MSGKLHLICMKTEGGSRGGDRGFDPPPGKSQVIWVSIGNKQFDPPSPEKVGPPWKNLDSLRNLEK